MVKHDQRDTRTVAVINRSPVRSKKRYFLYRDFELFVLLLWCLRMKVTGRATVKEFFSHLTSTAALDKTKMRRGTKNRGAASY